MKQSITILILMKFIHIMFKISLIHDIYSKNQIIKMDYIINKIGIPTAAKQNNFKKNP